MPIGAPELIVVLILALLVLGPKRLPNAARSLGSGIRGFKETLSGADPSASAKAEVPAQTGSPTKSA